MRILYIDCGMGAAGDMICGALLELLPAEEQKKALDKLNHIGLSGVVVTRDSVSKCGIIGSHIDVRINGITEATGDSDGILNMEEHHHKHDLLSSEEHHHEHDHHMHMSDIDRIISALDLPENVKRNAMEIYGIIAEAESHVHGEEVSEVHFHEVGMKDAIMDVAAVCMLMDIISPDKVVASPVHVGSGKVKCAHGIMPVPAPATAYILKGIPSYSSDLKGELCTPTGAALLKYFVDEFGNMPVMTTESLGYGMGSKDFPVANCLRMMLGEGDAEGGGDTVISLSCNLDDVTGEEISFAMERLYDAGAKEVFTIPAGMKKSRPGILLEVFCAPSDRERMIREIFKYTTTIGIRETEYKRYVLDRTEEEEDTELGRIRVKRSRGYGVTREKYEYDDVSKLALEKGVTPREIRESLIK